MGRYLRSCVAEYRVMGCLTYPRNWEEHAPRLKSHLRAFLERVRRAGITGRDGRPFSIFWFVEFQARGAPHIHFFCTHRIEHRWLARAWSQVVTHGKDQAHLAAGTSIERIRAGRDGTCSYARKYARKQEQKQLPPLLENSGMGRWWGIFGCREVVAATTRIDPNGPQGAEGAKAISAFREYLETAKKQGRARRLRFETTWLYIWRDRQAEAAALEYHRAIERSLKARARHLPQQAEQDHAAQADA